MIGVAGKNRDPGTAMTVEVPLAKMPRDVARALERLGDGFLLQAEGVSVLQHAGAIGGAAGEHGGTGG